MEFEYPKYKHNHEDGSSQIVKTREEEAALGPEWHDHPYAPPVEKKPRRAGERLADAAPDLAPGIIEYPKYKHHPDGSSVIVDNPEQEAQLDQEWSDFPNGAKGPAPAPALKPVEDPFEGPEAAALRKTFDRSYGELLARFDDLTTQHATAQRECQEWLKATIEARENYDRLLAEHNKLQADYAALKAKAEAPAKAEPAVEQPAPSAPARAAEQSAPPAKTRNK